MSPAFYEFFSKETYRSNYKECCNSKSLHSKWRNRIDGPKEKPKAVKRSDERAKV